MEERQKIEIGLRIKELRDNSKETSRSIADHVDVSTEAVRNWIAGKGISYDNAKKVAEMFGVDESWLWRGEERTTPDLLGEPAWIEGIRGQLTEILDRLDLLEALLVAAGIAQRSESDDPQAQADADEATGP